MTELREPIRVVARPAGTRERDERKPANPLDDSPGRKIVDTFSTAAGAADGVKSVKPGVDAVRTATEAGKLGRLGGLGSAFAGWGDTLIDVGTRLTGAVPWLAPVAGGLAKAAPLLGVAVAVLDVGKAVLEHDPGKKRKAQGMAVLSGIGGIAGVAAWGAAKGATAFGIALGPLAVPITLVGVGVTLTALADQFLLKGRVSGAIGSGLEWAGERLGLVV